MTKLDFEVEIPFVENIGGRCVPACAAMVLKTLVPEREFETTEVETLCGFRESYGTWAAQHLLSFDRLGLDVGWVEDDDLYRFAADPVSVVSEEVSSDEAFGDYMAANDVDLEARRVKEYLLRGLPFEQKHATSDDITTQLLKGWLVRLEVNGKVLANQEGYANHAVMVSGFNDKTIRLENPDGLYGSKPRQVVSWDVLADARLDGTGAMHYYRRSNRVR
jgi:hypothetical protein